MDQSTESAPTLFGFHYKQRETPMKATLTKQNELGGQLKVQSLKDALQPLIQETKLDFYNLFVNGYNISTVEGSQDPVRTSVKEIEDLMPFFAEYEKRKIFTYIEHHYYPEKDEKDCRDYLILEEETPGGVILAIFDYPVPTRKKEFKIKGETRELGYLELRGCYAVKMKDDNRAEVEAINLTSFWTGGNSKSRRERTKTGLKEAIMILTGGRPPVPSGPEPLAEENRVKTIALLPQNEDLTPGEQVDLIKEEGCLFIKDSSDPVERWLDITVAVAAFSQHEGDKQMGYDRTQEMLGQIRYLLRETSAEEAKIVERQIRNIQKDYAADTLPQATREAREWIRNRFAVALYSILYLQKKLGFALVQIKSYPQLIERIERKLEEYYRAQPLFEQSHTPLQSKAVSNAKR